MVVYSYYPFDPRVRKEVRALEAEGYAVDIICPRKRGEVRKEIVDGATVHRVSLSVERGGYLTYAYQYLLFFLLSFLTLTKIFVQRKHQIIHVHSLPDFQVFVALIPKLFGRKVILDLHEAMPEIFSARFGVSTNSWQFRVASFLESASCWFADKVITVNEVIKRRLISRGVESKKIIVVMNSPDVSMSLERDLTDFVSENDLEDKFLIVYVGGINPERNIEVLIQAVSLLKDEIPIHLLIFGYGKGDYIRSLKELCATLQLSTDVSFGGWIPHEEVLSYLNLSRIGVVSYVRNPLTEVAIPNKVLEFAALAKPLIIARLEALEELFTDAALFYEPENAGDLANMIQKLHHNEELSKELSVRARAKYDECSWEIMKERLLGVYKSLMPHSIGCSTKNRTEVLNQMK